MQSVVVPQGPEQHQQTGGCPKAVHLPDQGLLFGQDELLGEADPSQSLLPRKAQRTIPDLLPVEAEPRNDQWILIPVATE